MRGALFAVAICVAAPPAVYAQPGESADDAPEMSLGQVLEVAVRQSPGLTTATIDAAIADARLAAAAGIDDWLLAAQLDWLIRRDESVAGDVTGTDQLDSYGGSVSLSRLLPTGGTFGVTAGLDYSKTVFGFVDMESTRITSSVVAFLTQPLLRDRGSDITYVQRRQAQVDLTVAELERRGVAYQVVRDIVDAYWELALAYRDQQIRESSLALAMEQRRITAASVELGQIAQTELTAVDQIIATREEEIIAAALAITERSIALRQLAGLEINARSIDLKPRAPLSVEPRELDLAAVVDAAMKTSPEVATLEARGESATIDIEIAENGLMPRLDFSIRGGPVSTAGTVADSTEALVRLKGWSVSGDLRFETPLGRDTAKANMRAARQAYRRVEVNRRDLEAQLSVAAVRAVRQARAAAKRIEIGARVIALARTNVEAEKKRFELGRATNFDVLQRQEELKQAELRAARAAADYLRALNFVDSLTGAILEKNGIKL
jgi:outer membrane protein TolC